MSNIVIACPHCKSLNKLPKKDEYKKAVCGVCKGNLLENKPISLDNYEEFQKVVNSVTVPVIIDFWAQWCGPCQMFAPIFASVAKEFPLKAQFVKVDTDKNQQAAIQFGIRSIPTIIALKDSQEIDRAMGAIDEFSFTMWADKIIEN
jgi:thioredoxin 2